MPISHKRSRPIGTALRWMVVCAVLVVKQVPIAAQVDDTTGRLWLHLDNYNFFQNNEYKGSRVDGYTLPGFVVNTRLTWNVESRVKIETGVHWLHYWGAPSYPTNGVYAVLPDWSDTTTAMHLSPWVQAQIAFSPRLRVLLGSLDNNQGHQLPLPLYNPELRYAADPEAGVQMIIDHPLLQADVWVDWRKFIFNKSPYQEQFTAGTSAQARWQHGRWLHYIPLHGLAAHHGGEITDMDSAHVQTNYNAAIGLGTTFADGQWEATFEAYAMRSLFDTTAHQPFTLGKGTFLHAKAKYADFELDLSYWDGRQFIPLLGSYHFSNLSSNTSGMTHDNTRVISLWGSYTWRNFRHCTATLTGALYHYLPNTANRIGWDEKINCGHSTSLAFGFFIHLHPSLCLVK